VVGKAGLCDLEQGEDVWVNELIVDAGAFLVPRDDACSLEDAEMLRDVLLRRREGVDEVLNGRRPPPSASAPARSRRDAGNAAALAPRPGAQEVDVSAPPMRPPTNRPDAAPRRSGSTG
jgi:hypothetical protein